MDHRLKLELAVQRTLLRTLRTGRPEEGEHAIMAFIAVCAIDLDDAAVGEERGNIGPQEFLRVVAVGALEVVDLVEVHHPLNLAFGCRDLRLDIPATRGRRGAGCRLCSDSSSGRVLRRPAGRDVVEVQLGRVDLRISLVGDRWRAIGRKLPARRGCRQCALAPTLIGVGRQDGVVVNRLNQPLTADPGVFVLLDVLHEPAGLTAAPDECEFEDAALRGATIGGDIDNGLDLQVIVNLTRPQPFRTHERQ